MIIDPQRATLALHICAVNRAKVVLTNRVLKGEPVHYHLKIITANDVYQLVADLEGAGFIVTYDAGATGMRVYEPHLVPAAVRIDRNSDNSDKLVSPPRAT